MAVRPLWRAAAARAGGDPVVDPYRGHRMGLELYVDGVRAPSVRRGRIRMLPRAGASVPDMAPTARTKFRGGDQSRRRALGRCGHSGADGRALWLFELAEGLPVVRWIGDRVG